MTPLLLAVLFAQAWPLDGDGAPFQAAGRVGYIDAPVKGRCAVFNGVDAALRAELPAPAGDFTLSLWMLGLDPKGGPVFVYAGSALTLEEGRLRFQAPGGKVQTPDGSFAPNQWMHLAVAVQKSRAVIYVNGVEAAALDGAATAAPTALLLGQGADGRLLAGMMDEVRLLPRALSAEEIAALTDEGMPWLRPKPHARAPFAGKFELMQDDVVVFTGGENARAGAEFGYLE